MGNLQGHDEGGTKVPLKKILSLFSIFGLFYFWYDEILELIYAVQLYNEDHVAWGTIQIFMTFMPAILVLINLFVAFWPILF